MGNRRVNVVQVGYGYWGANIARNLSISQEFNLIGLCEKDSARRTRAEVALEKNVKVVGDYSEFLENKEVEAFVIATQTEISFEIAMRAMDAGKHIFIEKPIATTVERALKLKEKACEKKVILHCDHIMIYNPVVRYIKQMMDSGELGDLLYIDVSRLNLGPIRKDVNSMLDLAVHDLAVIDYLSHGEEPIKLSAFGERACGKQETLTYLTLKYPKFIAHVKSSWVSPLKERRTMIAGTKKMLIFDDMQTNKLTVYDCGIDVKQGAEYGEYEFLTRSGDIFIPNIPFEDSLRNSLEAFSLCVKNNVDSLSGPEQSLRVMKILENAMEDLK